MHITLTCLLCRDTYIVRPGERGYERYKRDRSYEYVCASCKDKLESDARASILAQYRMHK